MASLEFTTNLRLIDGSARTSVPTPEELPLGYMCFGIVNGRASIWGNYDGRVHDLVEEGGNLDITQTTGQSETAVMSQKAVTDAILTLSTNVVNSINGMQGVVKIDYSDVGAISANLSIYPTSTANLTPSARDKANIYIDDSGVSKKISLQQVKNMATKILSTSSLQDSKINNLDTDDYVFKKE